MKEKIPVLSALSREKLSNIFSKIPGKKDLILDPNIIKPLENIVGISILRSFGVDKFYKLHHSSIPSTSDTRVFLIYADLILVKYICDHINAEMRKNEIKDIKFHIVLIPRKLFSVMQLLEEEGVYEFVTVYSFPWELIPLDNESVLSLELKYFYNSLFVHGDQSFLPVAAKSLWSCFLLWGNPTLRVSIGNHSQSICSMIDSYFDQLCKPDRVISSIDCCIVVDRDVDYLSPMLTPATYTCLLDEVFGIKSGFVELNDGLVIPLNKQEVYMQIKNRHFSHVISFLKDKAMKIQKEYDKNQKMELQEMKQYVKNLPNVTEQKKSLSHHISACEVIIKKLGDHFEKFIATEKNIIDNVSKNETLTFIEDCIALNVAPEFSILRLMCLLSLAQNGISVEEANRLKTQFLHAYGYHYLPVFHKLEKLGLFAVQPSFNFADVIPSGSLSLKKSSLQLQLMIQKLKLVPSNKDSSNKKELADMNYVFSGSYTPAICQLIYQLYRSKLTKKDISKYFSNFKIDALGDLNKFNMFLIYFVGGVTYAEVATFQLFEELTGCQVIISATNIINGNAIFESCSS